jgi:hypothetical protein
MIGFALGLRFSQRNAWSTVKVAERYLKTVVDREVLLRDVVK